jgi:hypothetical protein
MIFYWMALSNIKCLRIEDYVGVILNLGFRICGFSLDYISSPCFKSIY